MLWYGLKTKSKVKKSIKSKSARFLRWQIKNNLELKTRNSLYIYKFLFLIPQKWNLSIIKSKQNNLYLTHFYLSSPVYFFTFSLPNHTAKLSFNNQLKGLEISFSYFYSSLQFYLNFVKSLFLTFSLPFFLKLKFKGKGYYIFKNSRNTITPQFGFSHRIYVYSFSILVKFLSKTTIFLFGLSKRDLIKNGLKIKNIRPINIFTGRGIRFAKQIVYRKVGKVSSYR